MNSAVFNQTRKALFFFALAGACPCSAQTKVDKKLAPAEVVTRHLESLGPAEARGRVHGMRNKGTCLLTVRLGGTGQVEGQVAMASEGSQNLINMAFDSGSYPSESLKFDGKKFTASQFRPGARTPLAQFFFTHEFLFKEGLIGGTLSASWSLLNLQEKNPKLEYVGIKKIGGKQLHALKYTPRKGSGSDMKITLFFDSETFQHVRTEYEETLYLTDQQKTLGAAGSMPPSGPQRASDAKINAFEEFSDFKMEGGLNLPHTYKFELSIQSEVRPALVDWTFTLNDFAFNAPVDAGSGN